MKYSKNNKGFGLIEVLVALAILAVGLMSIAVFQSELISSSSDSKSKTRALALAQSRLETLKNYTFTIDTKEKFNTAFSVGTNKSKELAPSEDGDIAKYYVMHSIIDVDGVKNVTAKVEWDDPISGLQSLDLTTEITWLSPSLAGRLDSPVSSDHIIRSATGRARLGVGEVTDSDSNNFVGTNKDTTKLLDRGDGDLHLTSGKDIVLTLEDACELGDGNARTGIPCTGFVEISGRVFTSDLENVFVIASDAAYCQRYYVDAVGDAYAVEDPNANLSGLIYYDYTCYLGGGWHGNIGLLTGEGYTPEVGDIDDNNPSKGGDSETLMACLGDPSQSAANLSPKLSIRRVYRGMAYDNKDKSIYYSIGVDDSLILPESGNAQHDFFVLTGNQNTEEACRTQMLGMLAENPEISFDGMPTDFFCLNQNPDYLDSVKLTNFGYSYDNYCPFDPSDPPLNIYIVSGSINLSGDDLSDTNIAEMITLETSDREGNCSLFDLESSSIFQTIKYECAVLDWGVEATTGSSRGEVTAEGWAGTIDLTPIYDGMICTPDNISFEGSSRIYDDTANQNFNCVLGEVTESEGSDDQEESTTPDLTVHQISVNVTGDTIKYDNASFTVNNGDTTCDVSLDNYSCSFEYDPNQNWSASVIVTSKNDRNICFMGADGVTITDYSTNNSTVTYQIPSNSEDMVTIKIAIMGNNQICQ